MIDRFMDATTLRVATMYIVVFILLVDTIAVLAAFTFGAFGKKLDTDYVFGLGFVAFLGWVSYLCYIFG